MPETVDQPTAAPTPKIQAVGVAGTLATLIVFVAGLLKVTIDPAVAVALATVLVTLAGYFKRNKAV